MGSRGIDLAGRGAVTRPAVTVCRAGTARRLTCAARNVTPLDGLGSAESPLSVRQSLYLPLLYALCSYLSSNLADGGVRLWMGLNTEVPGLQTVRQRLVVSEVLNSLEIAEYFHCSSASDLLWVSFCRTVFLLASRASCSVFFSSRALL